MKAVQWPLGFVSLILLAVSATMCQGGAAYSATTDKEQAGLPRLEITCNADSLVLIGGRYEEDIYLQATLRIDQQEWKHVRLRLRGDSSREFPKKSLKLKIPDGKNLPFDRSTLNLNAEYLDKSYLRQYICTRIFQASGQPCYATRHVLVNVNGKFHGIYLLVENVDDDFLERWKMSPKGDLFKATKDSACLSVYDNVRLLWERKAPKKDTTWGPLTTLIAQLNQTPDAQYAALAHQIFDYDNLVNSIAVNMLIGNRSTYYHNYFMYRHPTLGTWRYLPWDMDNTLRLEEVDDWYHRGNNADSHWSDMASNPLLERALATPSILRDIAQRVNVLSTKYYNSTYLFPILDSLAAILDPHIVADTMYHHHTRAAWLQEIELVKEYINQRPQILQDQFAHCPTSFQLLPPSGPLHCGDQLKWHPATDPDGDKLTYRLCYNTDPYYAAEKNTCHVALTDTAFTLPCDIAPGKYFWKVLVNDGQHEIRGFDNRSTFILVK